MRGGVRQTLLDEPVHDVANLQSPGAECPSVLWCDVLEYAHEEDGEHVVDFLLGKEAAGVGFRLQRNAALDPSE